MEATLTANCQKEFFRSDQYRGEEYFNASRVRIDAVGDRGLFATAQGSAGERYAVTLDFSQVIHNDLGVFCECPRFEEGVNCKHLWAVIRQFDLEYQSSLFQATPLEFFECDRADTELGTPIKRRLSTGTQNARIGQKAVATVPAWKKQLLAASRIAASSDQIRTPEHELGLRQSVQHWFAISIADFANESEFRIHLFESKLKNDRSWSIPTKIVREKSDVSSMFDAQDRQLFSLLDWGDEDDNDYYRGYRPVRRSDLRLPRELLQETLTALCLTGRFVWSMDVGRSLSDFVPVAADLEQPWQFILQLSPSEAKHKLTITPALRRINAQSEVEIRGVGKVVGACSSGAVLFENSIGIVRANDVGWVRGWQRTGEIELPANDLNACLQSVFEMEHPPELLIDERLGIVTCLGQPQGKLKLTTPTDSSTFLAAEVFLKYGEVEVPLQTTSVALWSAEENLLVNRDHAAESQLLEQLNEFPITESHYRYGESEYRIHRKWFAELVRKLSDRGWQIVAEGKLYRKAGNFDISVTSGEDWFDLNANVDFDGVSSNLPTLLQALRRGESTVVLDDGTLGILPEEWLSRFSGLAQMGAVDGDAVRFGRNQALLLDMLLAEQENVTLDRDFSSWCKRLKKFSGIHPAKQPRGFQGQLRNYQEEGLGWFGFLNEFGFGGCLADDMGLGKTIQVLALLEKRRTRRLKSQEQRKPSIAIVPKSLVFNWIDEGTKFSPKLRIVDYTGLDRASRLEDLADCDLVITTYATFRRDIAHMKDIEFDYAILDEAQAVKNPSSQSSKAIRLIKAEHRLAMTGTPVENHLGDLWSLFDFLNPGMLGTTTASSHSLSIENNQDRLQSLSNALRPFILRRTKDQVLKELPKKTEQTLYCDMSPQQAKLYAELRDHYRKSLVSKVKEVGIGRSKIHVLEALLRLRQAACDPRLVDPKQKVHGAKIDLLIEQLTDVVAEGHKVLIFSQFTSLLALVKQEVEAKGWKYEYLDGKSTKRDERVKRFQQESDCSLFLISLKAGGHGLNLTAAEYVYILDPWWNPAVEAQAIDRAHRMGQQKPVMAYRMIARGTVEDKIVQLQQSKRELADAIISADKSLIRQLSIDDLQVLFD